MRNVMIFKDTTIKDDFGMLAWEPRPIWRPSLHTDVVETVAPFSCVGGSRRFHV